MHKRFDVIVIGAGAAGMMCAAVAGQRGARVALVDHSHKLGEKIRISGGGRCNFTNVNTTAANFISQNPKYSRSALSAYTPNDFLNLVKQHRIPFHEKHKGQLFCDRSAEDIIQMLKAECDQGRVQWFMPCSVQSIEMAEQNGVRGYCVQTEAGELVADQLVVATGGLPVPKIGATDFGLKLAKQFDMPVVNPQPALVPLTFEPMHWEPFKDLGGVALPLRAHAVGNGTQKTQPFDEDALFTHRGMSGPAILQISSYWNPGEWIELDLSAQTGLEQALLLAKRQSKQQLNTVLGQLLPKRLAEGWLAQQQWQDMATRKCAEIADKDLRALANSMAAWRLLPSGTEGYKKAEVMRGGVDTKALNSKTMASERHPGLFFIGEVVDVTGWLGGYNFQWAWASGVAAGRAIQIHS